MKVTKKVFDGDAEVSFDVTDEKKAQVFEKIVTWCLENNVFSGESGMQDDDFQCEMPVLIADLLDDVIQFDVKFYDE